MTTAPAVPSTTVPAPAPPTAAESEVDEWEAQAMEHLLPDIPPPVRISILNSKGKPGRAGMVAVLLNEFQRKALEKQIGRRIAVVNYSNLSTRGPSNTVVYFREGFMQPALLVARVIPGAQTIQAMKPGISNKIGVDIEIQLGREVP